jgi:hypothetical protein
MYRGKSQFGTFACVATAAFVIVSFVSFAKAEEPFRSSTIEATAIGAQRSQSTESPGLRSTATGTSAGIGQLRAFVPLGRQGYFAKTWVSVDRYSLSAKNPNGSAANNSNIDASVGLGRLWSLAESFDLGVALGWGLFRETALPAIAPGDSGFPELTSHGPWATTSLEYRPSDLLQLRAEVASIPWGLGAKVDNSAAKTWALWGNVSAGLLVGMVAGREVSGVVRYEFKSAAAEFDANSSESQRHTVGLGFQFALEARPPKPLRSETKPQEIKPKPEPIQALPVEAEMKKTTPAEPEPVLLWIEGIVVGPKVAGSEPAPVVGATVSIEKGPSTKTKADGRFRIGPMAPGLNTLTISAKGLKESKEVVSVAEGQAADLRFDMLDEVDAPATIRGQITAANGGPVPAQVELQGQGKVRTKRDGVFSFSVPAGSYTLVVRRHGCVTQEIAVQVIAGEQSIHNIGLVANDRRGSTR